MSEWRNEDKIMNGKFYILINKMSFAIQVCKLLKQYNKS